jgi:hypothetical protein
MIASSKEPETVNIGWAAFLLSILTDCMVLQNSAGFSIERQLLAAIAALSM